MERSRPAVALEESAEEGQMLAGGGVPGRYLILARICHQARGILYVLCKELRTRQFDMEEFNSIELCYILVLQRSKTKFA